MPARGTGSAGRRGGQGQPKANKRTGVRNQHEEALLRSSEAVSLQCAGCKGERGGMDGEADLEGRWLIAQQRRWRARNESGRQSMAKRRCTVSSGSQRAGGRFVSTL